MNIFILSSDPQTAAQYHCDQHLAKMILESAQMFSTWAFYCNPKKYSSLHNPYKPTHVNHPCNKWLADSHDNRNYLYKLVVELNQIRLVQNKPNHAAMQNIYDIADMFDIETTPSQNPDYFALAIPSFVCKYAAPSHAISAYKEYYKAKALNWALKTSSKPMYMTYSNREVPEFMKETLEQVEQIKAQNHA
jgi:hypothetical protein